jgi:magnesium transporter
MNITVFTKDGQQQASTADLPSLLADPEQLFWVDMTGPTQEEIDAMHDVFRFHPLAIEDTHNQKQRPKIEEYGDTLFIILNTITGGADDLNIEEVDTFVGKHYLVTVHEGSISTIAEALRRIERSPRTLAVTGYHLFYVLVDVVVDNYFPVLDAIEAEIEDLGDTILFSPDQRTLNRLFQLKREMANIWRVVWPQREVISMIMRQRDTFAEQRDLEYYLRDVVDHLIWIADMINTLRDTLTSMMDLYMSATSNRLNIVVNRLTVITIAIGILTVFSGFYGMNFAHTWPPLEAAWAVPGLLVVMVSSILLLVREFRRRGWM